MHTLRKTKTHILCLCFIISLCLITALISKQSSRHKISDYQVEQVKKILEGDLKTVLIWTNPDTEPIKFLKSRQQAFISKRCPQTNCYVTSDRTLLGDYTLFDVIVFHGPELVQYWTSQLPAQRAPHQKYVFASMESSDNYPICSNTFDNFFNWTWTYKQNSDLQWGYFYVRDVKTHEIIGPRENMTWLSLYEMNEVPEILKKSLKTKSKVAAWFVSNCKARRPRDKFVKKLRSELQKYSMDVDIYGKCGSLKCNETECKRMLQEDYYFYLSFENSFSEDYVTEKLTRPLQNNVVPIVYGGANYTRFLPDGIYLNARELGPKGLAMKMHQLITNPPLYHEYFRWKSHYYYQNQEEVAETDICCLACAKLHDTKVRREYTTYVNFRDWWNEPNSCNGQTWWSYGMSG